MYTCQHCKIVVPANTKSHRVVIEHRTKHYPPGERIFKLCRDGRTTMRDDPGGTGYETVREIVVCPDCFEQLTRLPDG